ncbi:MAG: permease [Spirochaetota bacterium]
MKALLRRFMAPIVILLVYLALGIWLPEAGQRSAEQAGSYLKEMVLIMPPVFLLMGLIETWIPKSSIQKWLGKGSGIKGLLLSLLLGTLPTGPLYVAFPMAGTLLHKGASIRNMVLFLGSWAALKIPQLMVEVTFLGVAFTALRFVLTLASLIAIGLAMEVLLRWFPQKETG